VKGYSICEVIIGVLVIVFALWLTQYSKWILLILGVALIIHSFACKGCKMCNYEEKPMSKGSKRK